MPLCHTASQTGCVITFVVVPLDRAAAGQHAVRPRRSTPGMAAACTNPAALAGGSGELRAYLDTNGRTDRRHDDPKPWVSSGAAIDTPWVSVPGLLTAQVHDQRERLLSRGDGPRQPGRSARRRHRRRPRRRARRCSPNWGLHLVDVNLAMGNLLDIVAQQGKSVRREEVTCGDDVRPAPAGSVAARSAHHLLEPSHCRRDATARARGAARHSGRNERQPSRFMLRELTAIARRPAAPERPRLRVAADCVARFVGARGERSRVRGQHDDRRNAVLRSLPFELRETRFSSAISATAGVLQAANFAARERGATRADGGHCDSLSRGRHRGRVRRRRRAANPARHRRSHRRRSAIILPAGGNRQPVCGDAGCAVLADGAHAPGAMPLDVPSLGVDWYVANLHKWAFVPRSSGFLWAAPERQAGASSGGDLVGTRSGNDDGVRPGGDARSFAAPGGARGVRVHRLGRAGAMHAYNHDLVVARRADAGRAVGHAVRYAKRRWSATMAYGDASRASFGSTRDDAARLRDCAAVRGRDRGAVHASRDRLHVRVAAQIYNDMTDYERLAEAVRGRVK